MTSSIRFWLVAEISRMSTLIGRRAPTGSISPSCKRAQQLHLRVHRQLADLVEEQRAAVRLDELADVLVGRAGEGALLVAEQDRFDQVLRQRAAIDGDERLAAPIGGALDGARHQLLADARLAFDQHRNVRLGGALGEANGARHALDFGDDVAERQLADAPAGRAPELVLERVDAQRVLDRHLQPFGADRLDDEIIGAGPHRRDHRLDRAVRGLDDGGNGDVVLAHAGEHAHAVEIGHHQIEHDEIDRRPVGRLQPRQPGFARFRPVSTS